MLRIEWVFPTILIGLQLCAMGVYLWKGNMKMGLYWAVASLLVGIVTFMEG